MRFDDAVRLAYPIWVDLLGDVGRASGDAEHSAQVGENEPRFAIDHDDAHLIVGLTHSSVAAHLARTWRRQQQTTESRHRHTLRMYSVVSSLLPAKGRV
jgi:hypothetical protein